MALNDIVGRVLRPLGLMAAMYGCGGEERQGCQDDYDCREPRVCVQGYCEDSRGGAECDGCIANGTCEPYNGGVICINNWAYWCYPDERHLDRGDRLCTPEEAGNNRNDPACDTSLVTDICYRYWNECNLSSNSKTNYQFGNDLNDCIRRGCSFLQGVQTYPYYENDAQREELMEAIRCFADLKMKHSPELTCDALADDLCGLPEGDLYGCWINQTTGC